MTLLRIACQSPGSPEIFRSLQGEGRSIGRPRTFIRLSGCNLHCAWCDTPHTWNWEGTPWAHVRDRPEAPYKFSKRAETMSLTVDEVAAAAAALPAEGVVITGGEPLVQPRGLALLIPRLLASNPALKVEIETNGTIAPSPDLAERVDLFMVSPKLPHAGNMDGIAIKPSALAAFASLETAYFKFVARTGEDLAEVARLAHRFGISPSRIYIMAEGTDSDTVTRVGASLVDPIIAAGFNYSDRLHIHLFGDERAT